METNLGPEGCETNPIKVEASDPTSAVLQLKFGDKPSLWIVMPNGQRAKCYRSYSDYCDD